MNKTLASTFLSIVALAGCAVADDGATAKNVNALQATPPAPLPVLEDNERGPRDEIIYFVMPDRFENGDPKNDKGGLRGGKMDHGFDPTDWGFYHGGDLKGLTQRLDYIQGMGVTAIWLTPIFQNQAVQGEGEAASSGYHGYWITDFLRPDAHLGSREEFRTFVDAAHARGLRVYMDIITNHTADIFAYEECHDPQSPRFINPQGPCPYRSKADYPFTTRGGVDGAPINEGFLGDDPHHQTAENFAKLTDPNWAYTVYLPEGRLRRNPDWLNNPLMYHNRGESFWNTENELYGDFAGLDDLNTEHPVVVQGMIDIYKSWITDFRIDGYRIDTAKHVQPEFWRRFTPEIMAHAQSLGIDHFHIFGEVYEGDPGQLARYISEARLPSFLDFAFQGRVADFVIHGKPGVELQRLFRMDTVYEGGPDTAAILPTFLGNHDMGRFAGFLRASHPQMSDDEMLERLKLAHAMMFFSRGVPTIYYGDEQGFVSDGNDKAARENMFESRVASYNDNDLIGTDATTADDNFDPTHPLYQAIREMAAVRQSERTLRHGDVIIRHASNDSPTFVMSRLDLSRGEEIVIAFNGGNEPVSFHVEVDGRSRTFSVLMGDCAQSSSAPGSYRLTLPASGFSVCKASWPS
jgi:neopullulanase